MRYRQRRKDGERQSNKESPVFASHVPLADTTAEEPERRENPLSSLEELKEQEKQLLDSLDQVQLQYDCVSDKRGRLLMALEKNVKTSQIEGRKELILKLFAIETSGSKFTDGMVFTVMAEDHVWAEDMVRQWLDSNERETDKIDKIQAIVSRNVRAIVNVGSKLLDR
jgi:hypothetical protein